MLGSFRDPLPFLLVLTMTSPHRLHFIFLVYTCNKMFAFYVYICFSECLNCY